MFVIQLSTQASVEVLTCLRDPAVYNCYQTGFTAGVKVFRFHAAYFECALTGANLHVSQMYCVKQTPTATAFAAQIRSCNARHNNLAQQPRLQAPP